LDFALEALLSAFFFFLGSFVPASSARDLFLGLLDLVAGVSVGASAGVSVASAGASAPRGGSHRRAELKCSAMPRKIMRSEGSGCAALVAPSRFDPGVERVDILDDLPALVQVDREHLDPPAVDVRRGLQGVSVPMLSGPRHVVHVCGVDPRPVGPRPA